VPPSLATLSDKSAGTRKRVHEIKFDGYRIQARLEDGRVKLLTRRGLDWTRKFRPSPPRSPNYGGTALIDGDWW